MKKKLLFFLFFLLPLLTFSQQERVIIPVDWKAIEQNVLQHPDSVKGLIKRLLLPKLDTTLTMPERILAFYGQTYFSKSLEYDDVRKMMDTRKNNPSAALSWADRVLNINPFNTKALIEKADLLLKKKKINPQDSTKLDSIAQYYIHIAMRLFNTIATTGDGTSDHPFSVTSVSDEYNFLCYYLDICEVKQQSLIYGEKNKAPMDVLYLSEKSEYWDKPEIYFDIKRVLELETASLKKKK